MSARKKNPPAFYSFPFHYIQYFHVMFHSFLTNSYFLFIFLFIFTYQLEYDPPGELVTTKSVIPMVSSKSKAFTTINPKSGMMANCKKHPVKMAFLFFICAKRALMSTVADMPNMRVKRRRFPDNSIKSIFMISADVDS